MPPSKCRARKFADYEENQPLDHDPEDEFVEQDGESEGQDSEDVGDETSHYVEVGTSKLRQREVPSLGPKYRGTRVSRENLDASSEDGEEGHDSSSDSEPDEFDDPDTVDLNADNFEDTEIDSDEAFGESDGERFNGFVFSGTSKTAIPNGRRRRPVATDFLTSSEDGGQSDNDAGDIGSERGSAEELGGAHLDDMDDEDDIELAKLRQLQGSGSEESSDEAEGEGGGDSSSNSVAREELGSDSGVAPKLWRPRRDQKEDAGASLQVAVTDADKGREVRQQRRSFDSLLNIRIRLQKSLIAANSLNTVEDEHDDNGEAAYQAAEEAAVRLWNTIDSFRGSFQFKLSAQAGEKRKRDDVDVSTPSRALWEAMMETEFKATKYRRQTLSKWSAKAGRPDGAKRPKLMDTASDPLMASLDSQLQNMDRLVGQTRRPRSCAPVQAARKVEVDEGIYDDSGWYALLLKQLVEQRSTDTTAPGASIPTVGWAAIKEAKTRKDVDRKASKGRKMRFNVMEPIQNWMASEDRRSWEEDAIDRLFGTLFGQKTGPGDDGDEVTGNASIEVEGFKLFDN